MKPPLSIESNSCASVFSTRDNLVAGALLSSATAFVTRNTTRVAHDGPLLPVLRFFVDTGKNEAQNRRRSFTFFRSLGPSLGCFVTGRRAHLCFARSTNRKMTSKWILVSAVVSLAAFLCMTVGLPVVQGSADHVRWDIINFNAATTPPTVSAGGFAIAAARNNPSTLTIKLTGSGTFIGPVSGGTSSGATGGGTWQT